ncbi:hypothetical protein TIFTF001_054132, partial [Ficus carica]
MESGRPVLSARFMMALLVLILNIGTSNAKSGAQICSPSSCGDILNISSPFRLNTDPEHCGDSRYELSCEDNLTVLSLYSVKYLVKSINYNNYTIRIADANVRKDNCSSTPYYSLSKLNFSYEDSYRIYQRIQPKKYFTFYHELTKAIIFLKCEIRVNSSLYIDTAPCFNIAGMFHSKDSANISSKSKRQSYYYVVDGSLLNVSDLNNYCRVELTTLVARNGVDGKTNTSYTDLHNELVYGFELSWLKALGCSLDNGNNVLPCYNYGFWVMLLYKLEPMVHGVKTILGTPFVVAFLIYKWRRRHLSTYNSIEEFLHSHNNLMPIRYSYADIKKMTKNFKNKLGEGGYGSVFKGKLRSGRLVAIKMLSKSKGKGQDFINEI